MSDATCTTCPWWVQTVESLVQAKWYVEHDTGECRRNAPIPSPEDSSSWWAVTHSGDWCGEHPDRQPVVFAELKTAETKCLTRGDVITIVAQQIEIETKARKR